MSEIGKFEGEEVVIRNGASRADEIARMQRMQEELSRRMLKEQAAISALEINQQHRRDYLHKVVAGADGPKVLVGFDEPVCLEAATDIYMGKNVAMNAETGKAEMTDRKQPGAAKARHFIAKGDLIGIDLGQAISLVGNTNPEYVDEWNQRRTAEQAIVNGDCSMSRGSDALAALVETEPNTKEAFAKQQAEEELCKLLALDLDALDGICLFYPKRLQSCVDGIGLEPPRAYLAAKDDQDSWIQCSVNPYQGAGLVRREVPDFLSVQQAYFSLALVFRDMREAVLKARA